MPHVRLASIFFSFFFLLFCCSFFFFFSFSDLLLLLLLLLGLHHDSCLAQLMGDGVRCRRNCQLSTMPPKSSRSRSRSRSRRRSRSLSPILKDWTCTACGAQHRAGVSRWLPWTCATCKEDYCRRCVESTSEHRSCGACQRWICNNDMCSSVANGPRICLGCSQLPWM